MDSITNVVSLQEQLDAHIKDELETKNFQKAINTFLNEDSVKKLIEQSISLHNSASCNFEDKTASLLISESSQFSSFDSYHFCICRIKEEIKGQIAKDVDIDCVVFENEDIDYLFNSFIRKNDPSKNFEITITDFSKDEISQQDIFTCLSGLIGIEAEQKKNPTTLAELVEREKVKEETIKTFSEKLIELINTKEIKELLVKSMELDSCILAKTTFNRYNIALKSEKYGEFSFYIAESGKFEFRQEGFSIHAPSISVEFSIINISNNKDDICSSYKLKNDTLEVLCYDLHNLAYNQALDCFKKVVGVM